MKGAHSTSTKYKPFNEAVGLGLDQQLCEWREI